MPQDTSLLQAALIGYEHQIAQLRENMAAIQKQLRGGVPIDPPAGAPRTRRKMSAASRKRIAAAQKARWAKFHKEQGKA